MIPISLGFALLYAGAAVLWGNTALVGGCAAVSGFALSLPVAARVLQKGAPERAALIVGYAMLGMVAVGAFFVHFLFAGLLLISFAAIALVLPYSSGPFLSTFFIATLLVDLLVVVVAGFLPPMFEQPPLWFQRGVLITAVAAAVILTLRLLWVDAMRLRAAIRLRDEFLSVASHELKTPLTPLSLRVELLRRSAGDSEHLQVMSRQVQRLSELVNSLLDVGRIREGRLDVRVEDDVDLCEVVREVVARHEPEAQRSGTTVRVEADAPVLGRCDPSRVDQIVTNLLVNALKYGAHKPVVVRVAQDHGRALISVADHGIGISPDHLHRIFERFERGVSERHYGGLGLGLYITRELVAAMHGTVTVSSEPGKGATFVVELPLEEGSADGPSPMTH